MLRIWTAMLLLGASSGCTLLSLDSLQSGIGGAGSTGGNTGSTTTTTHAASTSTSSASSTNGSSSASGCADAFCASASGLDGCGDFDTTTHGVGVDWFPSIHLSGATSGTITTTMSDSVSCPGAVRADMVGSAGDHSWVQISRDVLVGTSTHQELSGMVKRTGPNGPLDYTEVFEADFEEPGGYTCQLFIHPDDNPTPQGVLFLQTYHQQFGSQQLNVQSLPLASSTGDKWTSFVVVFDWSTDPPSAKATIDGQTLSLDMMGVCVNKPAKISVNWGMSYEDRTETVLLDNLTTKVF